LISTKTDGRVKRCNWTEAKRLKTGVYVERWTQRSGRKFGRIGVWSYVCRPEWFEFMYDDGLEVVEVKRSMRGDGIYGTMERIEAVGSNDERCAGPGWRGFRLPFYF